MFQSSASSGGRATTSYTWKRVLSKKEFRNQEPGGRAGQAQFVISSKDHRLWIHGGQCPKTESEGGGGGTYSDELFCFDTRKKIWSKHKLKGNVPSGRAYHRVAFCTPTAEVLIEKGKKAFPRLVMYGGIEKGQLKKDISVIEQWTAFTNKSNFPVNVKNASAWLQSELDFSTGGSVPLPRCNHTMTTLDTGGHILVFGGWHGRFVNDCYVLDTEYMNWTLKQTKSNPRASLEFEITPRAGHTAVFVRSLSFDRGPKGNFLGPAVVMFGGQTDGGMQLDEILVLDITNWEWHRPRPQGREPVARSGHSAVLAGSQQDRIVIFGGWDGGKVRDDLHVLQIAGDMYHDWCWEDQTVKGSKVEGRIGHSASYVNGEMFIFGGVGSNQQFLGDLNCLHIPESRIDYASLSTAEEGVKGVVGDVAGQTQQSTAAGGGFVSQLRRNQIVTQKDLEKDLEDRLDGAVQLVSRRIQVLQAQQKESQENYAAAAAQNLREAKQKSVFHLVQNHGKNLGDAMAIANGFKPEESNKFLNVDHAAKQIIAQFEVPQPPKDRKKNVRSGNSAWHDAIIGGVEQMALQQIAVNGGLMKTWGALIDDEEEDDDETLGWGEQAAFPEEEVVDIQRATRYENSLERELEGESLQMLVQQQTEREFAFNQQKKRDHKSSQKQSSSSPNRRPKRLVNVLGEAPLALTTSSMATELGKIVNHGAVSTKRHDDADLTSIMDSLPQNKQPVPLGIIRSAAKIKALFIANMHRKRFERLRATVRIQAHVRRFITNVRLKRERSERERLAAEEQAAAEAAAEAERKKKKGKKKTKKKNASSSSKASTSSSSSTKKTKKKKKPSSWPKEERK